MLNISSARFASETLRQETNASLAAATAASTSSTEARSTAAGLLADRRVVDRPASAGLPGTMPAADPVADARDALALLVD